MADVLCPICGKPNSDHREFCDFCGNPLDGALRVESGSDSPRENFLDSQPTEDMDDASRLDSLVPALEEDPQPKAEIEIPGDPNISEDSRLDSYFSNEDDQAEKPASQDPIDSDSFNGGSRLDDYFSADDVRTGQEQEEEKEEDPFRLDDLLAEEEPPGEVRLESQSLFDDQEEDSSRLDEYLTPESPAEERVADDAARLNDFFADDPFKSPDPFPESSSIEPDEEEEELFSLDQTPITEPLSTGSESTQVSPEPEKGSLLSREDLFSDSPVQEPPTESEAPQLGAAGDQQEDVSPTQSTEPSEWDFLDSTLPSEETSEETPPEAIDPGEWSYLDPAPDLNEPGDEDSPGAIDPGEWDFLDPHPTSSEDPEENLLKSLAADEGDDQPATPSPQPAEDISTSEPIGSDEWDFLDPAPADSDQQELDPPPQGIDPETSDDWSFLDPGPTDDLSDNTSDPEPVPEEAAGVEDAGWLDMLQDPGSPARSELEPRSTPESQKPRTDWLEKIKRLNKSSDLVDEDSSFPDWLSATGQTAEFKATGEEESSEEVPEWLRLDDDDDSLDEFLRKKDLTNEEYKPKVTTDSLDDSEVLAEVDGPGKGPSDSQQIKFPSWAEEQKQKGKKIKPGQPAADGKEHISVSAEPFRVEDEHFDDLFNEELPSWLTEASSGEITKTFGENLAQGELPGWVEAMRPVVESTDASGLDEDEEYIENYGPLAGIPSVLPAEAEIGIDVDQASKKPLNLIATKSQQTYVDLLKNLIGDENISKSIIIRSRIRTQRVLRWLIAILMLVTVAGTVIFSGAVEVESPTVAQAEGTGFNALYEEIETLYDGQPVLIAFDYQPASAGELHTAAATVVDHLMEEGTYLSLISTTPTGPALAEHFLETTQSHHNYIHTQKYINLGYLPGQSAGLMSFMIAPQMIIPLAFDGSNAWDSPPLISVDKITDFKMILVITDDPNTAKIWIEQVGTRLDDTALTMVVGAQVEPLIQPYFRTSPRQINGYVAGIIDSVNYELLTERPFLANKIWLPFNIGIVISVGIIFIGGLTNGVLSLFSRRRDKITGDAL